MAGLIRGDPARGQWAALGVDPDPVARMAVKTELGVPFPDPIADGPVLQRSATRALRRSTCV